MLDDAIAPLELSDDEIGLDYSWKVGPASYDLGHRSFRTYQKAFVGLGQKPFAPVHLKASPSSGGDIALGWRRRTRAGGDSWEAVEVPLSQDAEAYEIDILDGSGVVRTLSSSQPTLIYVAADQIADFGAVQSSLSIELYQMSVQFGRGHKATATLSL